MNETLAFPYDHPAIASCIVAQERMGTTYDMNPVHPVQNLEKEISQAIEHPIGTPPLREIMRGAQSIAVLVDDVSRPTPAHLILPRVLDEIIAAGVPMAGISIVMALGSHRDMTQNEIEQKIGRDQARRFRVRNSRFRDQASLVFVGTSEDGVRILIDEAVASADIKVGIGSIVPHGAVGWSGGGKIIYPGVAGEETVTQFHFTHGLCGVNMTGREDCPVRLRMEKWVDVLGLDFIVNCVLTPEQEVYRVVAGHYVQAHRRGVQYAKKVYEKRIEEQTDIVIALSHPHDIDFWQAAKGIFCSEPVVRDGGTLLLVSSCGEGVGPHPSFPENIGNDHIKEILANIAACRIAMPNDPVSIPPAVILSGLRARIRIAVVSPGLPEEAIRMAGFEPFTNIQEAMDALLQRYPQGKVSLVRHCDLTFK